MFSCPKPRTPHCLYAGWGQLHHRSPTVLCRWGVAQPKGEHPLNADCYAVVVPLQCRYVHYRGKYRHYSGNRHYSAYCHSWLFPSGVQFHRHYSGQPALYRDRRTSTRPKPATSCYQPLPTLTPCKHTQAVKIPEINRTQNTRLSARYRDTEASIFMGCVWGGIPA